MFGVNPCTTVLECWESSSVCLSHRALGSAAIKAITAPLMVIFFVFNNSLVNSSILPLVALSNEEKNVIYN